MLDEERDEQERDHTENSDKRYCNGQNAHRSFFQCHRALL